jgi:hypothetical protein
MVVYSGMQVCPVAGVSSRLGNGVYSCNHTQHTASTGCPARHFTLCEAESYGVWGGTPATEGSTVQ